MPNADEICVDGFGEAPLRTVLRRRPDILILGVGRSGTSKVAEILNKNFGVCFGHHENMLKDFRGEIVYEDQGLKKMIKRVVKGEVAIEAWIRKFGATHNGCTAKLTGAKLLDFAALTPDDFFKIGPRLIIRTFRPFRSCVESWVRYRMRGIGIDADRRNWAEQYVAEREQRVCCLVPTLSEAGMSIRSIFFDPECFRWTDEQLINKIGDMLSCL